MSRTAIFAEYWCMVLLVLGLCRSCLHTGTQRQYSFLSSSSRSISSRAFLLATAQAFSPSTNQATARNFHCSLRASSALFGYVNGESSRNEPSDKNNSKNSSSQSSSNRREGKTGWNHNLPSESSDFWDSSSNRRSQQQDESSSLSSSSSSGEKLRTGWLHNTKSPSEREKAKKSDKKKGSTTFQARRRLELAMKQQERNHRIIAPPTFHAVGSDGTTVVVTEHLLSVPVERPSANDDNDDTMMISTPRNTSPRIDIFFCIIEKADSIESQSFFQQLAAEQSPQERAASYVQHAALKNADTCCLYLQGGPGFGAPTPAVSLGLSQSSSWAAKALKFYSHVVLMDQRGTGRSTPITKQTLQEQFPNLFLLDRESKTLQELEQDMPEEAGLVTTAVKDAVDYMTNFRADNIVQDAEEIRDALLLPSVEAEDDANHPWGCTLGQSFGGFCLMTYLSQVQYPPKVCLFTGGIAPMLSDLDQVYDSLWDRVKERSLRYYEMYPGDISLVKKIVKTLLESPAKLPSGGTLTARRFLQLGLGLGGSPSSFATMHSLLASAMLSSGEFSRAFLKQVEIDQSFDDHPIYFWLHESIYANQGENAPTNWSAHRMFERKSSRDTNFNYMLTSALEYEDQPTLFFGEMVFPWMATDYAELSGLGLQQMANEIAQKSDWGSLYNVDKMKNALADGRCRAAAAVYYDDMYVDFNACAKLFSRGGPMEKCKVWITNEYQHSGLRDNGSEIFQKLHGMAMGSIRTPS